ncbi:MAG: RDD family protein [Burkholderiales bacterium]
MSAPGILRRLAAMTYEGTLLFGVAFVSTALFLLASGGASGLEGWRHLALQVYLGAVFAGYFLWCWLRGGQTLAMKAWHIRLVAPGQERVPPGKALLRFVLAALLLPCGIGILWALFDPERQFLHDRLAGTRLVSVPR